MQARFRCFRRGRGLGLLFGLLFASQSGASPLFEGDSVIDVTLTGPFGSLLKNAADKEYLQFSISAGGVQQAVKLRARGHSRLELCTFPPLRLGFQEHPAAQGLFAGQRKIKMVSHCRSSDRSEQDVLEEYAAYRIFNVVTDYSYRVRLLRLQYIDSDGMLSAKGELHSGFLIEPQEEFAARTGAEPAFLDGFPRERHDARNAALMYVTQYLIGNTDWMLLRAKYDDECCHNVDLFELDDRILAVPYDFDLAGLVYASYARPDPKLRIKRVTQRLYRGLCTERVYLEEALDLIDSRRDEITAAVLSVPGLDSRSRKRTGSFLERFFKKAQNRDDLLDSFEHNCLTAY